MNDLFSRMTRAFQNDAHKIMKSLNRVDIDSLDRLVAGIRVPISSSVVSAACNVQATLQAHPSYVVVKK